MQEEELQTSEEQVDGQMNCGADEADSLCVQLLDHVFSTNEAPQGTNTDSAVENSKDNDSRNRGESEAHCMVERDGSHYMQLWDEVFGIIETLANTDTGSAIENRNELKRTARARSKTNRGVDEANSSYFRLWSEVFGSNEAPETTDTENTVEQSKDIASQNNGTSSSTGTGWCSVMGNFTVISHFHQYLLNCYSFFLHSTLFQVGSRQASKAPELVHNITAKKKVKNHAKVAHCNLARVTCCSGLTCFGKVQNVPGRTVQRCSAKVQKKKGNVNSKRRKPSHCRLAAIM